MEKIHKLVFTALLAALVCVSTLLIQIPSPMNGYINLGDCFVLLSGWILGPVWGFMAGGLGSALADLLSGYSYYAPGTLLIKGAVALSAALLGVLLQKSLLRGIGQKRRLSLACALSGVAGECIMVLGYFIYAGWILGSGLAAAMSIPGNLIQGCVGILSAVLLMRAVPVISRLRVKVYMTRPGEAGQGL